MSKRIPRWETVVKNMGLGGDDVEFMFAKLLACIQEYGGVHVPDFGVFRACERAERLTRNPRTGEKIKASRKVTLRFKPDKKLVKYLTDETVVDKVADRVVSEMIEREAIQGVECVSVDLGMKNGDKSVIAVYEQNALGEIVVTEIVNVLPVNNSLPRRK